MKGCLNQVCGNSWRLPSTDDDQFCNECGHEMQESPRCPCGRDVNVKLVVEALKRGVRRHCEGCGQLWTELRISAVFADQLQQDMAHIKQSAQELRELLQGLGQPGASKRFEVN